MMKQIKPAREKLVMSAWWHRRETEGDVIVSDIPEATATSTAPAHTVKEK